MRLYVDAVNKGAHVVIVNIGWHGRMEVLMVHLSKLKALPRWAYVGLVGFLGAYSYSYLHAEHPTWTDAARYGVLPLLQASGALGWAKARAIQLAQPLRACPLRRLAA